MLFAIEKVEQCGLYWLDEVFQQFIVNSFDKNSYSKDLFPNEFSSVLNASAKTNRLCEEFHTELWKLEANERETLFELYQNHQHLLAELGNTAFVAQKHSPCCDDVWKKLKELGKYLYESTLGMKCFRDTPSVSNYRMDDHFEAFRKKNNKVCCFCGINWYQEERTLVNDNERQWRAGYDHYLPKKHYPFLAVDFNNLIPTCDVCNEKAKQEKNILIDDAGNRRNVFNPFDNRYVVRLKLNFEFDDASLQLKWSLEIDDSCQATLEKMETWDWIYLVISRGNKLITDSWIDWLNLYLEGVDITNLPLVRKKFNTRKQWFHDSERKTKEAYFISLFFQTLENTPDDDLSSILNIVKDAS